MPISAGAGFVIAGVLLAGAVYLLAGWRWRVIRGGEPRCRRCLYCVIGVERGRCPECGNELTQGQVVRGTPRRRWSVLACGVMFLVGGVSFVGWSAWRVDWYSLQPTGWLISDLGDADGKVAKRAWDELMGRVARGAYGEGDAFPARYRDRIIEIALANQAAADAKRVRSFLLEFLGACCGQGQLTEEQKKRFFDQAVSISMDARKKVVVGNTVPFRIETVMRIPGKGTFLVRMENVRVSLDGAEKSRSSWTTAWGGSTSESTSTTIPKFKPEVGKHELGVDFDLKFQYSESGYQEGRRAEDCYETIFSKPFSFVDEFEVVDRLEPVAGGGGNGGVSKAALEKLMTVRDARVYGNTLAFDVAVQSPPVPLAFDVFVQRGGDEIKAGTIVTGPVENPISFFLAPAISRDAGERFRAGAQGRATMRVILRSNPDLISNTVELLDCWEGEIVIEDVPVDMLDRAKKPAGNLQ